ncbi:ABC transporter permease, partial [Actinotignum timonense]|nr:ABC transporter permease [Actinotignum timonense]
MGAGLTEMYLGLALFAGALLVIPISSLASGAARLGTQDRSQRLASLRLVGTTRSQTIAISLCETVVQWLLGTALGTVLYLVTLPGWRALSFLGLPINPAQMLLPVPFIAAVIALLFVVTLVSALGGLMRVSISPLGV